MNRNTPAMALDLIIVIVVLVTLLLVGSYQLGKLEDRMDAYEYGCE